MTCTFKATIGGKFAPQIGLRNYGMYIDTMISTDRYLRRNVAGKTALGQQRCSRPLLYEKRFEEEAYESEKAKEYTLFLFSPEFLWFFLKGP